MTAPITTPDTQTHAAVDTLAAQVRTTTDTVEQSIAVLITGIIAQQELVATDAAQTKALNAALRAGAPVLAAAVMANSTNVPGSPAPAATPKDGDTDAANVAHPATRTPEPEHKRLHR